MKIDLSNAPLREPSQFVGFAGNCIDRQSENRSEDSLSLAFGDPSVRLIMIRAGRLILKLGNGQFDPYFPVQEAGLLRPDLSRAVLLGHDQKGPVIAAPANLPTEDLPETLKAIDFRSVYVQGLIDTASMGALAQGASLLAWHSTHRFCGRCGGNSVMGSGGYRRECMNCGREQFPRTDPVAIMLAIREGACLLGRSPHFNEGMYSCLAGFIEPGETIEDAVRRETLEESGIRIGRVSYHASQPWPFPHSLMIGCHAEALSETVMMDANELEDCRWFVRKDVQAILSGERNDIFFPPAGAIARHLIASWANGMDHP